MRFVWVGVGGAVGSVIRYAVGLRLSGAGWPWATLTVNVVGSFLIGFLLTWGLARLPSALTVPLTVGLVGGFTTFSTFAWESLELIGSGRPWQATAYLLTSVSGGILAAVLGRLVAQELL